MKVCAKCEVSKDESEFKVKDRKRGYLNSYCNSCQSLINKEYYKRTRKRRLEISKKWQKDNPNRHYRNVQKHRRKPENLEQARQWRRESWKRCTDKTKEEVFRHYGGKCACCGETEPLFLQIDHIDGNGNKHRKEISGRHTHAGKAFYTWLRRNSYPEGFQILCANCNFGKRMNGGVCPHKVNKL